MIKALLFLIFLACAGVAGAWLMENAGSVTMFWLGHRIDTSVAFLLVGGVCFAIFCAILLQLIFVPSRFLRSFFERRATSKLKNGIAELTYSIAALAASDIHAAEAHTKKMEKLLGCTPLTILLNAQIAKSKGDEVATTALLEQLLLHKETNYLAARSLSETANKQDNLPKALMLAKQAQQLNPKDNLSSLQVLNLQVRMKAWAEAEATLQAVKLPRGERNRLKALINIIHGEELLANGDDWQALRLAQTAFSALPDFPPAADLLTQVSSKIPPSLWTKLRAKLFRTPQKIANEYKVWRCRICNHTPKKWNLHCENCHGFDTLE